MPEHAQRLIKSAEMFGWDLVVIQADWRGFGTKVRATCEYFTNNPEITHFVFCDAFDVVILGTPQEFMNKMYPEHFYLLASVERGLWPPVLEPRRNEYSKLKHRFNYLNSGLYYVNNVQMYIESMKDVRFEDDDQLAISEKYLAGHGISTDWELRLFNSHSFIDDGEYTYENNRVQILGQEPIFIHSNGKTVDEKLNQMLEGMGL